MLSDVLIEIIADLLVVPIVIIGALAMFRLPAGKKYQKIARGVVTGLVALLFAKIISLFYQGERPFVVLGEDPKAAYLNNPGFPSDHVLFVCTITLVVWASTKRPRLGLMLLAASILVAAGRILALVHTPIDVLGGLLCAVLAAFCLYGRQLFSKRLPS